MRSDVGLKRRVCSRQVPYVVLLLKARELWQSRHDGQLPTSKTRGQFVDVIKELAMDPEDVSSIMTCPE